MCESKLAQVESGYASFEARQQEVLDGRWEDDGGDGRTTVMGMGDCEGDDVAVVIIASQTTQYLDFWF